MSVHCRRIGNRASSWRMPAILCWLVCCVLSVNPAVACKYSVRDLAFVNVHGSPWRLVAIRPDDVQPEQLQEWTAVLDRTLNDSNVEYQWTAVSASVADSLRPLFADAVPDSKLRLALIGPGETPMRIWPPVGNATEDFETTLRSLVQSPLRDEILDKVAACLCVMVIVEGREDTAPIHDVVAAAAETTTRGMWTFDKAPRVGPQVVVVPVEKRTQERWMLTSLGVDPQSSTTNVVLVYGQGRCLGQPISAEELDEKKLARMAAICGRDCECDLDRTWLYGKQMLHIWSTDRERLAESNLDFDPKSAMVVVEASQILQRQNSASTGSADLPNSSGLVIHDLSALEQETLPADVEETDADQLATDQLETTTESAPGSIDTFGMAGMMATLLSALVLILVIYFVRQNS